MNCEIYAFRYEKNVCTIAYSPIATAKFDIRGDKSLTQNYRFDRLC